jgi:hypothetical protein
MRLRSAFVAIAFLSCVGAAWAEDELTTITLSSGETMRVHVLERTPDALRVQHPLLGELTVPTAGVQTIAGAPYEPPVEQIAAQPEEAAAEAALEPEPRWETSLSLGLTGSEGNTENLSLRARFDAERLIKDVERFQFESRYRLETADGDRTQNEWYNRAIQEWFLPESPRWSWFVQGEVEYDEFQGWDVRVAGQTGLGYVFIDREETLLRGRAGLGAAYEFGADDERLIPEAVVGYDWRHDLNDRSRLTSSGNLFYDLEEGDEFRSYIDLIYELDMTADGKWALELGATHRYESDSEVTPWDVTYFAALVLKF